MAKKQTPGPDKNQEKILDSYLSKYKQLEISAERLVNLNKKVEEGHFKTVAELDKEILRQERLSRETELRKQKQEEVNKAKEEQNQLDKEQYDLLVDQKDMSELIIDRLKEHRTTQQNIFDLTEDQVKSLQAANQRSVERVKLDIESGRLQGEALSRALENLKLLEQENEMIQKMNDAMESEGFKIMKASFEESLDAAKKLGDKVDSIFDSIPGGKLIATALGFDNMSQKMQDQVKENYEEVQESLVEAEDGGNALFKSLKASGGVLKKNLVPAALALGVGLLAAGKGLLSIANEQDEKARNLTKQTGLTHAQSEALVKSAGERSNVTGNVLAMEEDILAVQTEAIKNFGPMGRLSDQVAVNVAETAAAFGISNETAGQVQSTLMQMGMDQADAAKLQEEAAADAYKAGVSAEAVMADIAANAKTSLKYFGGNPKALKKAAIEAAKLGRSVADMVSQADALLDIEGSLEAQFKFQALTGKEINLDKARALALDNKLTEAAAEVQKQMKQAGIDEAAFVKMKKHEREELAKATGVELDLIEKSFAMDKLRDKFSEQQIKDAEALGMSAEEMLKMKPGELAAELKKSDQARIQAQEMEKATNTMKNALLPIAIFVQKVITKMAEGVAWFASGLTGSGTAMQTVISYTIALGAVLGAAFLIYRKIRKANAEASRNTKERVDLENESMEANKVTADNAEKQTELAQQQVEATQSLGEKFQSVADTITQLLEQMGGLETSTDASATNMESANVSAGELTETMSGTTDQADALADKTEDVSDNIAEGVEGVEDMTEALEEAAEASEDIKPDATGGGKSKGIMGKAKDAAGSLVSGIGGGIGKLAGGVKDFAGSSAGQAAISGLMSGGIGNIMSVGDLAIDPNGGPVVSSPREGGIYQGTKNDGVSMSPSHGGAGSGGASIDYDKLGSAVAAAIAANPPQVNMDGQRVSEKVSAQQSMNKGRG